MSIGCYSAIKAYGSEMAVSENGVAHLCLVSHARLVDGPIIFRGGGSPFLPLVRICLSEIFPNGLFLYLEFLIRICYV